MGNKCWPKKKQTNKRTIRETIEKHLNSSKILTEYYDQNKIGGEINEIMRSLEAN